jgi:hypothetical protein
MFTWESYLICEFARFVFNPERMRFSPDHSCRDWEAIYFFGGLLGLISTRLGRLRSG